MGNASSVFDCAVNPLHPMPDDGDEIEDYDGPLVLEDAVPLRDSVLWSLQRQFYEQMGIRAWVDGIVPNFVTSNAFIARAYARMLVGFLRDVHAAEAARDGAARPTQPVYILEVGSGHGKHAFLVVEALVRFRTLLPPVPFVYVVTDPCAGVVASIRAHPALAEWVSAGIVDTAVFDAERGPEQGVTLQGTGVVLRPGTLTRPAAVVCSYVLDSLRCDAVRVTSTGGALQATTRITMPRGVDGKEALGYDMLGRARIEWGYKAVTLGPSPTPAAGADLFASETYASSPLLQNLVRAYAATPALQDARALVLIPVGAVTLLSTLLALTSGRLLLVVGDKGHTRLSDMEGPHLGHGVTGPGPIKNDLSRFDRESAPRPYVAGDPHIAMHGSFSLMVNLHALRQVVAAHGGRMYATPAVEGFKTAALMFGSTDASKACPTAPLTTSFPIARPAASVLAPLPRVVGVPAGPTDATRALVQQMVDTYGEGLRHAAPPKLGTPPAAMLDPKVTWHAAQAGSPLPGYGVKPDTVVATTPASCCGNKGASCGETCTEGSTDAVKGFRLQDDELESSLSCVEESAEGTEARRAWACTLAAVIETLSGFTPEDFAVLQRGVKEEVPVTPGPSLRLALSLIRLACHDADVFLKVKDAVIEKGALQRAAEGGAGGPPQPAGEQITSMLSGDIRRDAEWVYSTHYALQPSRDVHFELGRVLMGQRDFAAAVGLFRASNDGVAGQHQVTWHNMGLCYFFLGDLPSALSCFDAAVGMHGEYVEARQWADRVRGRLAGRAGREEGGGEGGEGDAHALSGGAAAGEDGVAAALGRKGGEEEEEESVRAE